MHFEKVVIVSKFDLLIYMYIEQRYVQILWLSSNRKEICEASFPL